MITLRVYLKGSDEQLIALNLMDSHVPATKETVQILGKKYKVFGKEWSITKDIVELHLIVTPIKDVS